MDTQELLKWSDVAPPAQRFNDLDTEVDGLDFGCDSNAITGGADVSIRQETVM